jgi:uncharacterized repeat protein (TIGR01451 family)
MPYRLTVRVVAAIFSILTASTATAAIDLAVSKTGPTTAAAGSQVVYTVVVQNIGTTPAATVTLTDNASPSGMTFVSLVNDPAFSCITPTVGTNGTITCTAPSLAAGASATFTITMQIDAGASPGDSFTNTATAATAGDSNSSNDSNSAVTFVAGPDLTVSKTGPDTASAGSQVVYTVVIQNIGDAAAGTVTLTDNASPSTFTFVSMVSDPAFSCSTPSPGTNGTITCTAPSMAAGASATFSITMQIDPQASPGDAFTNEATATTAGDPDSENNTGSTTTFVPANDADIGVLKNGPSSAGPNTDVSYEITVFNGGPTDATSFQLNDTLPGTMTFVSIIQNSGPAFSCSHIGSAVTCSIASLVAGSSADFTLVGHIPSGTPAGTTFNNKASVTSSKPDNNPDNNDSSAFLVVSSVDLSISKSGPSTITAGQNITYHLTFANGGPDTASSGGFDDSLPAGTTFVSLTHTAGNTSGLLTPSCTTPPVGSPGTVSCAAGGYPAGGTDSYDLVLNVSPTFADGGALTNTATTHTDSFDSNSNNNSGSSSATVTGLADISVTKSGPATAVAGTNISYSITVTNNGPAAASAQLTDALPAGTTLVSFNQNSGPSPICSTPSIGANGTVTCTWASLGVNTPATFTLVIKTATSATGSVSNTANVSTTASDTNGGNNSSTATTTLTASADVMVTKTGPSTAVQNQDVSYTIVVTNNGPSDAQAVTLNDPLPATTTFVSYTQNSGPAFSCTPPPVGTNGTFSCTIATLAAGASANFTLVVHTTLSTPPGPMSNTAVVSTATSDPNSNNNSSTAAAGVSLVDLAITKTPQPPAYGTGQSLTWTLVVTNNSATPATGVTVTDVLPAGTTFTGSTPPGACTGTTTITCTAATLNANASVTFTITVTLPSTPGPITNTATVSSATTDANPADNTATSTITVIPASQVPMISPLALLLLCIALAAAGAIVQRHP